MKDKEQTMQPLIDKMVKQLLKESGISFSNTDSVTDSKGLMNNVVFTKGEKSFKLSYHSLYRVSGMMQITKDHPTKENQTVAVPLTDAQWIDLFIKPIVVKYFEL